MKTINTISTIKRQVVVVGAGAAGITAAIAAARNGAETLLAEYNGFLGGISATLAWLGFHDSVYRQVVKGLPMEFVTRLQQVGAASRFVMDPKCSSAVARLPHRRDRPRGVHRGLQRPGDRLPRMAAAISRPLGESACCPRTTTL